MTIVIGAIAVFYFGVYDTAAGRCGRGDVSACAVVEAQTLRAIGQGIEATPQAAPVETPALTQEPVPSSYAPGLFELPADLCAGSWEPSPNETEWWCYLNSGEVGARLPNAPFQALLERASAVSTRADCTALFPDLFWYAEGDTGPAGSCRSHQ